MSAILLLFHLCLAPQQSATDLQNVVINAFANSHDGYSSDEVLLDDHLNEKFVEACRSKLPETPTFQFNWTLINLRKAGKLAQIPTTKRRRSSTEKFRLIAELAARSVLDQEKVSIDRIFADPRLRKKFDERVRSIDSNVDLYSVRKSTFQLRKARKLRPELITRIADWDRKISTLSIKELKSKPDSVPEVPGIYIFHDSSGYLYIGQSMNLRNRLKEHLDKSSNLALESYLQTSGLKNVLVEIHAFGVDSRAKELVVRRAYESALINSRKPKFNILP